MNTSLSRMSRTLRISIRIEQPNPFANFTKREEVVRQEVSEYIKKYNLDTSDDLEAVILYLYDHLSAICPS